MRRVLFVLVLLLAFLATPCLSQPKKKGSSTKKTTTSHKKKGGDGSSGTHAGQDFVLQCASLPFESIATKPDPFVQCDNCGVVSGSASSDAAAAGAAFSQAKNDFCASFAQPTPISFAILRKMQAQAKTQGLVTRTIPDRSKLHNFFTVGSQKIGEGDVVRLVAWIKGAHISDCKTGETVNCNVPGFASNDLHIVLMDPTSGGAGQDDCSSATAEMSPHFRPAAWSNLDLKTPNKNVVRFTGPLFFDNAHQPCASLKDSENATLNPKRSSIWEVHPVYQFDVCTSAAVSKCDVNSNDASIWVPYDKWVAQSGSSTIPTGKKFRSGCKDGPQKKGVVVPQCPVNSH
jgi:hypothetical protein